MSATAVAASYDLPAGTVGAATVAIARGAGLSIAAADGRLLTRPAPQVRGRMDPVQALMRIASASGLRLTKVGPQSYVLSAAPASGPRPAPTLAPKPSKRPAPAAATVSVGQEIIVSANKRDVSLRHLAGAWQRIQGDEFTPSGVVGTEAIEKRSAGFSSTHLGAGRNKLFIRGIADSSFSGPTQSPVGQYFGDLRTTYSGPDPDLKLVDMQSVEILEGPQGTIYGAGALGGILLLKPNMPVFDHWQGAVAVGASATWHGDPGYDVSAVLNAPIARSTALRIVGYRSHEGGYIDNRATGQTDINEVNVNGGRAVLTFQPAPGWAVDLTGVAQAIDGADSQYADRDGPPLSRSSLVPQPFSSDFGLSSLVIRKDSGTLRFRSTTGVSWQNVAETYDASTSGETRRLRQRSKARALSNETRLWRPMTGGFSWLVGVSSIVHRYDIAREIDGGADARANLAGSANRVRETTIYGEAGVELLPGLEVSAGGRFTHSSLTGSGQHLSAPLAALLAGQRSRRGEQRFLPSLALLGRPIAGLTLYAKYQQGFRPGGLSIAADTARFYRGDQLATSEAGFRYGHPGGDGFYLQASATFSRWRDIQADFLDASGLPVTDNIGDGRVWTLSSQGEVKLTDALRLDAGMAWTDGRITKPTAFYRFIAASAGKEAMDIPNIAGIVGRGAINWQSRLGGQWSLDANLYARYVGSSRLGIGPRLGEKQGNYTDTGLVLRFSRQDHAISLSATNLTGAVGNRFAFGSPLTTGADLITPLRPRTVRLGFEQTF